MQLGGRRSKHPHPVFFGSVARTTTHKKTRKPSVESASPKSSTASQEATRARRKPLSTAGSRRSSESLSRRPSSISQSSSATSSRFSCSTRRSSTTHARASSRSHSRSRRTSSTPCASGRNGRGRNRMARVRVHPVWWRGEERVVLCGDLGQPSRLRRMLARVLRRSNDSGGTGTAAGAAAGESEPQHS